MLHRKMYDVDLAYLRSTYLGLGPCGASSSSLFARLTNKPNWV